METVLSTIKAAFLLTFSVALFCASTATAKDEVLQLHKAIEISLKNNIELNLFREEKGIRDAGVLKSGVKSNPTLDLEVATGALTGSSKESSLSLGVSQEFLLGGKREKRASLAERELDIYRWQLADKERLLKGEVKSAFYDALLAKERLLLAEHFISLNRQLLDVSRERLTAGDIPELELNLVKVELARSEGAKIEIMKSQLQSNSRLFELMGGYTDVFSSFQGEFDPSLNITKSVAELKSMAKELRPDFKALEAEKLRADSELNLAEVERTPDVTGGLFLKRDTTGADSGGVETKDTSYTIGIKISVPLQLYDRNQSGIMEASVKRGMTEKRLISAIKGLDREVESAFRTFQKSSEILSLYSAEIIPQLEENLKLTQEAYRLGEVGILAVIQEQKKFFEVSDAYLTALHDRQASLVKLESVTASEFTGGEK